MRGKRESAFPSHCFSKVSGPGVDSDGQGTCETVASPEGDAPEFMKTPLLLSAAVLAAFSNSAGATEGEQSVLLFFDRPTPASCIGKRKAAAQAAQSDAIKALGGLPHSKAESLWVINALAVTAAPETVDTLSKAPGVLEVRPDPLYRVEFNPPQPNGGAPWNLALIGADSLWAEGVTGAGVTVGVIDTGVNAEHPELAGRLAGWFDAVGGYALPYDDNGHGTHVTGIVCGSTVGVAPGARYLSAKALDVSNAIRLSWALSAAQWIADPDGDGDMSDAPFAVNCSWSLGSALDRDFAPALELWRSAGIVPVFSVGNTGPDAFGVSAPGNDTLALAVGATDTYDAVAGFSGRGPAPPLAPWNGIIKPDISAPGAWITSAKRTGGYEIRSGTSQSAAHATGTLALMKQADFGLTDERAITRIRDTAVDMGPPGPDPSFGHGRLDAHHSVRATGGYVPSSYGGTCRDTTGSIVPYAVVNVSGTNTVCDYAGRFSIPHVSGDSHHAVADAPGFAPSAGSLTLVRRMEPILVDGDTETGGGWTPYGPVGGCARSDASNHTLDGRWSLKVAAVGDGVERGWISEPFSLPPGNNAVTAIYAWRATGDGNGRVHGLDWLDSEENIISTDYGTPFTPHTRGGPADGVWRTESIVLRIVPPVGAASVRIRLGAVFPAGDTTSALWFDDASIDTASTSPGDADGDGIVTLADALLLIRYAAGMESAAFLSRVRCDFNRDGLLSVADAVSAARLVMGL